ncbi:SpoIIE family protein phosphatase [Actinomadura scrupuli]|uniref:PP2C family protein-serine/threonine phosphatase n=1 Tax=Actinomadura scrupuli TaxID=559629 RepID=UPI003D955A6B
MLDREGHVRHWGVAAQRFFGYSAVQAAGRHFGELLLHGADGEHRGSITWALTEVAAGRCWSGVLPVERADGRVHDAMFCWEPLRGAWADGSAMVTAIRMPDPRSADDRAADDFERLALLNAVSTRIGTTLHLGQTARDFMDVTIPRFADFAGIYVLERLLREEALPDPAPTGSVEVRRLALGLAVLHTDAQDWVDAFPADEVVVYRAVSPFARCMSGGEPVLLRAAEMDAQDIARIRGVLRDEGAYLLEQASMLAMPLKARGTLLGFVAFTRRSDRRPFHDHDVATAEDLAAQAAICIDNARLYDRERRTAQALQENLIPKKLTVPLGWEIAHRNLPASRTTQVGGDWFDVIALSETRVGLVIGDAMGHDAVAAAAMGRLRTAVRALAGLDLPPAELLRRLDQVTHDTDPDQCATCIYAVCDLTDRSCAISRAGHVPPILFQADGSTTVLDLPPGLPLGVGQATFETTRVRIPDGSTLVLYTDGLVESRDHDIDTGITALRTALDRPRAALEAICDTVTTALPNRHDDVSLLLTRLPSPR